MPRSHRLADYAEVFPAYGQNVVRLATLLSRDAAPVHVVDVGANIGDTAAQVLHATDARVLCVEGDPHWLPWLATNAGTHREVTIVAGLLTTGDTAAAAIPERHGGTTRFVRGSGDQSAGAISVADLLRDHPDFHATRLIKSDTDGYDVVLVPALAAAYAESRPVLFMEYDEGLSRQAGNDPALVWDALAGLGYTDVAVWDGFGTPVAALTVDALRGSGDISRLTGSSAPYWDVAVAHGADEAGRAAVSAALASG